MKKLAESHFEHYEDTMGNYWTAIGRPFLMEGLLDIVRAPDDKQRSRHSIDLHFYEPIAELQCADGEFTTQDGKVHKKDVIVAADGIHVSNDTISIQSATCSSSTEPIYHDG